MRGHDGLGLTVELVVTWFADLTVECEKACALGAQACRMRSSVSVILIL
jgi:hypothetical protein